MSTAQFAHPSTARLSGVRSGSLRAPPKAPTTLAVALLAMVLYAAFSHGAVGSPAEARVQVALAVVTAIAVGAWLWTGTLRLAAPRLALTGVGLLTAFAAWSAITLLWSVAPDETWLEFNRVLAYVLVLVLAVTLGASSERSVAVAAEGFLLVVLAVTIYALGQKLVPGLHVSGIFNLNQPGSLPRLQEPLGYWNALALMLALAAPLALAVATDRNRSVGVRIAAAIALQMLLLTIGFTYSRGGLLALVVGMALAIGLGGAWLRSLLWLGVSVSATAPPLVFGLVNHSLTATVVSLGSREAAGALLSAILIISVVGSIALARRVILLERTVSLSPERSRVIARILLAGAGLLVLLGVVAMTVSSRGLTGTVSHAWTSFTTTHGTSVYDPHRLLSADSANRWVWWKEAAGAFSDRPVGGWGAGSFPVTHLLYRQDTLSVKQPHSVPLQWLAETGLIGALLGLAAVGLLVRAGFAAVRTMPASHRRLLMAAMLGAAAAYAVHACYDWDWDIPAVTFPALLFLGLLAGAAAPQLRVRSAAGSPSSSLRLSGLVTLTLVLCVYAISAVLPSLASSAASSAIVTAAGSSPRSVQKAQHDAALASRLDPLSDAGPRAQATIALRQDQLRDARGYLLDAVRREPSDAQAWSSLAYIDIRMGDTVQGDRAAERALALDPRGQTASNLDVGIFTTQDLLAAPPRESATAQPLASP